MERFDDAALGKIAAGCWWTVTALVLIVTSFAAMTTSRVLLAVWLYALGVACLVMGTCLCWWVVGYRAAQEHGGSVQQDRPVSVRAVPDLPGVHELRAATASGVWCGYHDRVHGPTEWGDLCQAWAEADHAAQHTPPWWLRWIIR